MLVDFYSISLAESCYVSRHGDGGKLVAQKKLLDFEIDH